MSDAADGAVLRRLAAVVVGLLSAVPASVQAQSAAPSVANEIRIVSIRARAFGSVTGQLFDIAPEPAPADGPADPYDDLPQGRPGREPADSFIVDVEMQGPPGTRVAGAGLTVRVFAVPKPLNADGTRRESQLVASRSLEDLAFGPSGTRHEAVFVVGHLCWQDAVLVEIARPRPASMKAELPFSCGP